MIVKINLDLYMEVASADQAQEASRSLNLIDGVINRSGFPDGEALDTEVNNWTEVSEKEADERGLTE